MAMDNIQYLTDYINTMAEQFEDEDRDRLQDELIQLLCSHGLDEDDLELPQP